MSSQSAWVFPCPVSVEQSEQKKGSVHYHSCRNGPDNVQPDWHVCDVCGAVFFKKMDFEKPDA